MPIDNYELNSNSFMGVLVIDNFNFSPDFLSNFFKFVSRFLIYMYSSALMLKFDIRGCQNMFDLYVSFKMNKKVGAQKKKKNKS